MTDVIAAENLEAGLWPISKAAVRLGVSVQTARRWVRDGEFPIRVLRFGGRMRVSVVELERFLEGEAVAP